MTDVVSKFTRSKIMSSIRGRNTRPELVVRSYLHSRGLRFRIHQRNLPGRPDIVLPRFKVAIFVNGCFWHQHPGCRFAVMPKSNRRFWNTKLKGNRLRDVRNVRRLRRAGWRVSSIWECALGEESLNRLYRRIVEGHVP
jgi:DNA mismatch endonuclease (patch repair protein)